ncbi:MAG: hypothetical protein ACOYO1_07040 [Bacteroidales bacterium]
MKRKITFYTLAITSIVILFINGCKKDDTSTTTTTPKPIITTAKDTLYYVQYDGKKYQIDNAHIFYTTLFEGSGGCYFYYAYFVMKGVSFSSNYNHMIGTGDGLRLKIISSSSTNYVGTYAVDTLDNNAEPNDLLGTFYISSEFGVTVDPGISDGILRGNCTISKITSDTVLVTGSCNTNNNKFLKLNYKGILPRHEINY